MNHTPGMKFIGSKVIKMMQFDGSFTADQQIVKLWVLNKDSSATKPKKEFTCSSTGRKYTQHSLHILVPAWLIKAKSRNIDCPLPTWSPRLVVKTCLDPRADTCSDATNIETDMIDWGANKLWDANSLEKVQCWLRLAEQKNFLRPSLSSGGREPIEQ